MLRALAVCVLVVGVALGGAALGGDQAPGFAEVAPAAQATPGPYATPDPAHTFRVRLRAVKGKRGSGVLDIDRHSGLFDIRISGVRDLSRRRAYALWLKRPKRPHCRVGFLPPTTAGIAEGTGQLPRLPKGVLFTLSEERSANSRRPRHVVLRGRSRVRVQANPPSRTRC